MKKIKVLTLIILSLLIPFSSFAVFAEVAPADKIVFYFDAPANFTDNDKVVCSLWSESAYYSAEGENLGDNLYKFQVENINDYSNMVFCGNSSEYIIKTSFLHGSKGMFPAETYEAFSDNLIDINGKVFTDSIHYISNDFTDNFSFGRWLDYSTWEHKVKFTEYIAEKGFTFPDLIELTVPDFWYRYKELYSDNKNYVLVFGSGDEKKNTPAYDVFGEYILKQDETYAPYEFGYFVYLIKEDKFITLREAVDENIPDINKVFTEYGIGISTSESESTTIPTSVYTEPVAKTSITLNKSSASLYVKGTTKIKATVKNGVGKTVYKSSNPNVAKVDANGKVTALKAGVSTIKVTNNNVSKNFKVTVIKPKLNYVKKTIKVKDKFTLKVTGKIGKVKFTSSKKSVATVSSTGVVKAKKKGNAVITVIANGVKLQCAVKVK